MISTPGKIYAAGDNSNGRYPLVHKYTQSKAEDAQRFRLSSVSAQFCAATWEASTIVDDIQRFLTCGTGHKGELGLGPGISTAESAVVIRNFPSVDDEDGDDDAFVADISASMSHSVVLLSNGSVYGWGAGRKAHLGEPAEDVWTPRKITGLPFEPHRVACGRDFTLFCGSPESGELHILGTNDRHGILSSLPTSALASPINSIHASWSSAFVLLQNGHLIAWGRNDHGQLGPQDGSLPKLAKIAVGSEHVVALTTEGKLISWGWGEHGNCGPEVDGDGDVNGSRGWNEISLPEDAGRVIGVGAGCATTFIWTDGVT